MDIISTDVRNYFMKRYQPCNEGLMTLRQTGEENLVPIIMRDTEMVLSMLLRMRKPKKILEIGTAIGYSALYFATSCPGATVYTIEMDPLVHQTACRNVEMAGMSEQIHLLQGDGESMMEKLRQDGIGDFDFVFIDAAKSHYLRFLEAALKIVAEDALIVSDNILIHGMTVSEEADPKRKHLTNVRKMREYLDVITTDSRFQTTLLPIGDGLAITEYKKEL